MNSDKIGIAETLRKKTETFLAKSPDAFPSAELGSVRELAQELLVYQSELEMQNEALRETRQALQETRDRFASLYEYAPVGYVVLDASGIIRQTNATWREMLKREEEDFRGLPFMQCMAEEDAPIFLARFRAFFRNPAEKQIVVRMRRKGGELFYARVEAKPRSLSFESGADAIRGELMVIVSDVTELHEALQKIEKQNHALQQANERTSRLNAFLGAIRNVNQLITQEDDRERLIQGACKSLARDLNGRDAWIVLLDETGLRASFRAQAGLEGGCPALERELDAGRFPPCVKRALAWDRILVVKDSEDRCADCPVSWIDGEWGTMVRRLTFGEKTYGALAISIPLVCVDDREQQGLFEEVAGDLAFALHKIETAERLEESRLRYQEIFQGSRDGFVMVDAHGCFLDANQAYCDMLGYSPKELRDLDDFYSVTPEKWRDWEATEIWNNRLVRLGFSGLYEKEYIRKDGTVFPVELQSYTVRGKDGAIDYLWGTARDISARKEAEETILRNTDRLKAVVDILQYRADGMQDFLDFALEKAIALTRSKIGYIYFYDEDRSEFVLNTWSRDVMKECAVANPQTRYELDKTGIWGEAVRQRKPILVNDFQADNPLKKGHPEGHVLLNRFLTVPVFYHDRIVAVVGVANKASKYDGTDVLELTLLMDAVWKSVENMKSNERIALLGEMLDEAPVSIMIHDANGEVLYANRASLPMHGYKSLDAFLSINLHDLDVHESRAQLEERFQEIARAGEALFQAAHYRRDGSTFPLEVLAKAIRWQGEAAFLSIAVDTSDRKQAEEDKARLQAQLLQSQKMESVGRLAGGIAHDFNNMVTVILGHTEMASLEKGLSESMRRRLTQIRESADRSVRIVRQLLAFARKQTIAPRVLNLNDTVGGMLTMFERLIGEDIHLVWVPGADLWPVRMDPSQIDQILANLCVNARDAIADVGKITIETRNVFLEEEYCADHAGFLPGRYVLLTVSDDGCGMEKEILSNIFEPFFTTKTLGKGTGLGLATVYGIVKQNEGFINVYSELEQGSAFNIYLPRYTGEGMGRSEQAGAESLEGGHETVLLVEDEPMLLEISENMLKRLGYHVIAANSPSEAIRLAQEHAGEIHLLLTDVVLPGMNGRNLAEQLLSQYPGLQCLFMSGYTANVIAHHGVLEPDIHFIQKPFSVKDLALKVGRAIKGKH